MSRLRSSRTVSRELSPLADDDVTPAVGVAGAVMAEGGDVDGMGATTPMGCPAGVEPFPFLDDDGFLIGARALEEVTVGSAEAEVEGLRGGASTRVVLPLVVLGRVAVLLLFSSVGEGWEEEEDGIDDNLDRGGSEVAEEAAEEEADDGKGDGDDVVGLRRRGLADGSTSAMAGEAVLLSDACRRGGAAGSCCSAVDLRLDFGAAAGLGLALLDIREGLLRPPPPRHSRRDGHVVFRVEVRVLVAIFFRRLRYCPGRTAAIAPPGQSAVAGFFLLIPVLHEVEALHPLAHAGLGWWWRVGHGPPGGGVVLGTGLPVSSRLDAPSTRRQRPRVLVLLPRRIPPVARHHRFPFEILLLLGVQQQGRIALAPAVLCGLFGLVLVNVEE
ncbi:hypothetical protein PG985_001762 [Apiospora marii]|uniref:uncharacterized protein n=1 Tax=Apiospora marii TaxID=335849 RepID=UPI0031311322